MKIIDIHSHILPGFDDGASDERESLRMLKMAAKQGITGVIATPHFSVEYPNRNPEKIRQACKVLEEKAKTVIHTGFSIYPGQEILYNQDTLGLLEAGEILTMADSRYVLVEFMPWIPYSEILRCVRTLSAKHYYPVLAHVERYEVLRESGRLEELIQMGALFQMNYRRIDGKWYEETTRWCRKMLKKNNIHFLGTDMHNTKNRKPSVERAVGWMDKHLETRYFRKISYSNAQRIIKQRT